MTHEEKVTWLKAFSVESAQSPTALHTPDQLDRLSEELDDKVITEESVLTTGI